MNSGDYFIITRMMMPLQDGENLSGGFQVLHQEEDEVEFTIGDGDADLQLDTGSGSIRISQ